MAMQPLDDQSLSGTTGKDGLNIGVQVSKVDFNQVALIDTDGYTTEDSSLSKAALVIAANPNTNTSAGIDFVQTFNEDGSIQNSTSNTLNALIDTDAGTASTGGAFSNIALSFGNNVNGIRIRPLSVYLVPDNVNAISSMTGSTYAQKSIFNTGTTMLVSNNIKELLRTENIDVAFVAGNQPTMNLQLGAAPQGHMVMFGGAVQSICGAGDGCNINLVSGNTGAQFDLQMTGMDSNGFSLNGFYAGIEGESEADKGAFVFGNEGTSDKFNLNLNNVMLGTKDIASTDGTFNNLPNGSIGNIGLKGASITDFKMRVSGM